MEPIYDQKGQAIAWLNDTHIYRLYGSHVAFLNGDEVYSSSGHHLGIFKDGFFRDHRGMAVAFRRGAQGEPALPKLSNSPIRPFPSVPPIPATAAIPPAPATPAPSWAALSWEEFVCP